MRLLNVNGCTQRTVLRLAPHGRRSDCSPAAPGLGVRKDAVGRPSVATAACDSRSLPHHTTGKRDGPARGVQLPFFDASPMGTVPARAPSHFAYPDPCAAGSIQ